MTQYRKHNCYGKRAQIIQFLHQACELTKIDSAEVTILVDKNGEHVGENVHLSLPFTLEFYAKSGCDIPDSHQIDEKREYAHEKLKFSASYQFTSRFKPTEYWVEAVVKNMKSKKVNVSFQLGKSKNRFNGHGLVVKGLLIQCEDPRDIELCSSLLAEQGVEKKSLFTLCSNFFAHQNIKTRSLILRGLYPELTLEGLELLITQYPTSECDYRLQDKIERPYVLNRYGKLTVLQTLPSFDGSPVSVWLGQPAMQFCNEYVEHLINSNRMKYIAVSSPNLAVPEGGNKFSLRFPFDPLAFYSQLIDTLPILEEDDYSYADLKGIVLAFASESIDKTINEIDKEHFEYEKFRRLIFGTLYNGTFSNLSDSINAWVESSHSDEKKLYEKFTSQLARHYSQAQVDDYGPLIDVIKAGGDRIVFEASDKKNHADHCSLAMLTARVVALLNRSRGTQWIFRVPSPCIILHVDFVTSPMTEEFSHSLRCARRQMIAPFLVTDEHEKNQDLLANASHRIKSTSDSKEFDVEYYFRNITIRTSNAA
ncbi:hypothetical protein J4N45_10025 [Vibrio sp. SCSIO 43140]|uniref:hypothetical protein n=1 Tax=Vibrio sp. SCSIO 43140 TaxID=2819100 RepID=UPI002074D5DE|nr:hypothetical protein [Vibrio sp. SCSIO 43140]USD58866.1 hypothetical protein J4N45_10025 [Vibrio sp. SCSIO 43140]